MTLVVRRPAATVCIPWRPSPARMAAYERVRRFWAQVAPEWPVVTADSGGVIFSLAQARNNAVRKATTPVVIVSDADTIPDIAMVRLAVLTPAGVTWPASEWRLIPADYAGRPLTEFPGAPVLESYPSGLGATIITTRDEWWRLGGQDETFQGWGYEDCAFHTVVQTLSTFRRLSGVAYSIDHEGPDNPGWTRDGQRNRMAYGLYLAGYGRPWLMREIVAGHVARRQPFTAAV